MNRSGAILAWRYFFGNFAEPPELLKRIEDGDLWRWAYPDSKLVQAALRADKEAVDLYRFTSVLNHALDEEGRTRIVQMMFEIAYNDGKLSEFEDNVVWRASELLNVPARERVTLRRQMREEKGEKQS